MGKVNIISDIVGGWSVSDVRLANLSDSINMFVETQGKGSSATSMLRSISGSSLLLELSDRPCRGIFECSRGSDGQPVLFTVFGSKLFLIQKADGKWISNVITSNLTDIDTPVSMCETGGEGSSHPHLIIADGQNIHAVATDLDLGDMKNDVRTIALPYKIRQDDAEHPTARINPTHVAYCWNYIIVNDADTDAFYTSYQYPFERTYTKDNGAESFVKSINTGIAKVNATVSYRVTQNMTPDDLTVLRGRVNADITLTENEKTRITSLIDDFESYTLWNLSSPGQEGEIDYDIFMINPWRAVEVGYKDYGFITYAEWSPDNITALYSNGSLLYTWGPKSTQIFNYNNSETNPWVSPTNCANGIGIKAVHSIASVGDYVFYLGSSSIGENGIYQFQSNQLTKISTPDIERKINTLDNSADAKGQCWTENGHLFYAISFINGDYTLVYDILEGTWHRRSSKDKYTNAQHYWRLSSATLHDSKLIFGTSDGKLVYLNQNKFDEYDGRPMIRTRRSGAMMDNYQDFFCDGLKLICNTGDFNNSTLTPKIMMRYCDNGGEWSNQEMGSLGPQGHYNYEVEWWNLGLHNVMNIEFSCSDPVNFCIMNGKINYVLCDSF